MNINFTDLKVLVVDDNPAGLYTTSKTLKLEGFNIIEAVNGNQALQMTREHLPDVIILDVKLPDISGFEVCKIVKADPVTSSIPVIHLSATYVDSDSRVQGLEGGADAFLTHPVEPKVLIATIAAMLRIKKAEIEVKSSSIKINRQNMLLRLINQIYQKSHECETLEDFGQACLDIVQSVTKSEFGFIGELGSDGHHHDIAISDPGWNKYNMVDKTGHRILPEGFEIHGLYGQIYLTGKSLLSNNPSSDPHSVGVSEGHPALTSFLGVPFIQENKVVGILAVVNREGGYSKEDQEILEALTPTILQEILRKRADRELKENRAILNSLLRDKELLLIEVHHRIKNNMNTINSLFSLQADTLKNPETILALKEAQSRVRSMMILYDKLYQSTDFKTLEVSVFLNSLINDIINIFPNSRFVTVEKDIDEFRLNVKKLQPLGIIINELLTNIMKYAFADKKGGLIKISVKIKKDHVTVVVWDNGVGIPESIKFEDSVGFGHLLINNLTEQLDGKVRLEQENGTKFILEFDR